MIDFLSHSNLSINYTCLLGIQANPANAVVERIVENNSIYVPPQLEKNKPIFYVIDNCDFQTDTPDGKNSFHGTICIVFQNTESDEISSIKIQRDSSVSCTFTYNPICMEEIKKPAIPNFEYSSYFNSIDNNLTFHYNKSDLVWSLTKSVTQSPNNMPLWSAYNNIITDKKNKIEYQYFHCFLYSN